MNKDCLESQNPQALIMNLVESGVIDCEDMLAACVNAMSDKACMQVLKGIQLICTNCDSADMDDIDEPADSEGNVELLTELPPDAVTPDDTESDDEPEVDVDDSEGCHRRSLEARLNKIEQRFQRICSTCHK